LTTESALIMAERKPSDSNDRIYREYPAGKALRAMVIPTIVSQIIAVAYNMADTFFVGLTNDKNAVAAVSLCLPVYTILTAISNLFGIGGASAISRALGEGNKPKAKQAFALAVWGSLILGLIYALDYPGFPQASSIIDRGGRKRPRLFFDLSPVDGDDRRSAHHSRFGLRGTGPFQRPSQDRDRRSSHRGLRQRRSRPAIHVRLAPQRSGSHRRGDRHRNL
jgi:hypothetical protein